ncbi:hypothetical protein C8J57DRAFT_445747 [Mycena rebaudengoi]|nr:hypothetical protein C8J57DRAFT_445747 [Mycena rebaudengoi]
MCLADDLLMFRPSRRRVNDLPLEILSSIFRLALRTSIDYPDMHGCDRINIRGVCTLWDVVLVSDSTLWSSIYVALTTTEATLCVWLRRSKMNCLTLHISAEPGGARCEVLEPVFNILKLVFFRCCRLIVTSRDERSSEYMMSRLATWAAPALIASI